MIFENTGFKILFISTSTKERIEDMIAHKRDECIFISAGGGGGVLGVLYIPHMPGFLVVV
jgi:hypothetical protein